MSTTLDNSTIHKARENDLEQIYKLYLSNCLDREKLTDADYKSKVQQNGFLLGLDTQEDIQKLFKTSEIFLVCEVDEELAGYIISSSEQEYKDDENKVWFDINAKETYYKENSISIYEINVNNKYAGSGIGSELLKRFEEEVQKLRFKYLFSVVTISPVTNIPSLTFHEKNSFVRLAMGKPTKLFGINNYSSILYVKDLTK